MSQLIPRFSEEQVNEIIKIANDIEGFGETNAMNALKQRKQDFLPPRPILQDIFDYLK